MNKDILVSIIIVSYNSKNELEACLQSVEQQGLPVEVYIVDNNSTDDTPQVLVELKKRFDFLHLIFNKENKGLAYANNQPIPYVKGKYVLVLNPDSILGPDTLKVMVEYLESNPKVGVVGPLCVFEDGHKHSSYHTNWGFIHIVAWRVMPYGMMRYLYDSLLNRSLEKEVLFVSGACYLIPTQLFKSIGGYDPQIFLSVSDLADIGVRVKKLGYKTVFYPKATITHFGGRSNNQVKYLTLITGLTGDLYFLKKHKGFVFENTARGIFILNSLIRGTILLPLSFFKNAKRREKINMYFKTAKALSKKNYLDDKSFLNK